MVGVPGRSKGCHTCRRRKIKCDQGQPSCQRCLKSKRECEGYEKGPVFLNRTAKGLMRRAPLEEAIITRNQSPHKVPVPDGLVLADVLSLMPPSMNNSPICISKLEDEFIDIYMPKHFAPGANPPGAYIANIVSMTAAQRGAALDYAIRALWMSRLGKINGDPDMFMQGELAYGAGLRHLQEALYDKRQAVKDKTLAAASLLSLYELYESTVNTTDGHDNHKSGLIRMVQWRGKESLCKTLLGQRTMELTRWDAMIHSIQFRKRSPLGDAEWRSDSWVTITDFEQQLYDRGFDCGALLEDTDSMVSITENQQAHAPLGAPPPMAVVQSVIQKAIAADESLEEWYGNFNDWSTSPVYWEEPFGSSNAPQFEPQRVIQFANLRLCHLMLDFWGLHLILSSIMTTLFNRLPPTVQVLSALRPFAERVSRHKTDFIMFLANLILDGAPYSLRPEMGLAGPNRSIFGVRVALFIFRMTPGEAAAKQCARCEALIERLATDKGVSYAKHIANVQARPITPPEKLVGERRLVNYEDPAL